ncbi:hypothetical protein K8I28_02365 [bacterium]|nr:hypothetical protein [bacterium]
MEKIQVVLGQNSIRRNTVDIQRFIRIIDRSQGIKDITQFDLEFNKEQPQPDSHSKKQ